MPRYHLNVHRSVTISHEPFMRTSSGYERTMELERMFCVEKNKMASKQNILFFLSQSASGPCLHSPFSRRPNHLPLMALHTNKELIDLWRYTKLCWALTQHKCKHGTWNLTSNILPPEFWTMASQTYRLCLPLLTVIWHLSLSCASDHLDPCQTSERRQGD